MNPNNAAHDAAASNHSNQGNPNNPAHPDAEARATPTAPATGAPGK